MAYENECRLIEEFIDAVDELVSSITEEDMAKEFFSDELERVRSKSRLASSELEDIRMGGADKKQEALIEAKNVRTHIERAKRDLDDCIDSLED